MIAILMAHKTWLVNQLAVRLARQLGIMFGMNISLGLTNCKLWKTIPSVTQGAQGCCRQMMYKYLWNLNSILMCDYTQYLGLSDCSLAARYNTIRASKARLDIIAIIYIKYSPDSSLLRMYLLPWVCIDREFIYSSESNK